MKSNDVETRTTFSFSHVRKSFHYEHLIAGLSGGVISTLVLHPLDLIKIRFSVSDGLHSRPKYGSMWECAKSVWSKGGFTALYRGATPNIVGNGTSWGLYFLYYNTMKVLMGDGSPNPQLSIPQYLVCGCAAGSMTLALTNPIWIAKTRMCLQYENDARQYRGMWHALYVLYQQDGFRGLYKGFVPGLIGTSHGAIQFLAYEKLKHWYRDYYNHSSTQKLGAAECILMSAFSKILAASSTYPYQVVRARIQDQHQTYNGIFDVIMRTWRNESWRGFYKGLGANLLRVTPACCITFSIYENVSHFLLHQMNTTPKMDP